MGGAFVVHGKLQRWFDVFWKLHLKVCSCKWRKPSWSLVTTFIPITFWQLRKLFGDWLINFRTLEPKLLIEIIPFNWSLWNNKFFKKLCLALKRRIFSEFIVMYDNLLCEIILNRSSGNFFLKKLKQKHIFLNQHLLSKDSKTSSWYIFCFEVLQIASDIAMQALHCIFSRFWWNDAL